MKLIFKVSPFFIGSFLVRDTYWSNWIWKEQYEKIRFWLVVKFSLNVQREIQIVAGL